MHISTFLPFWDTARSYSAKDARGDAIAALTIVAVGAPQAMAYALIAGVHPKYGIYAFIVPVIIAALWGSSRFLVAGPTNAISMILLSTVAQVSVGGVLLASLPESERMPYIFGLALLAGGIQVAMGVARLGDLVNFISHSVMVGFGSGAALLIAAGQLKNMLGLDMVKGTGFFAVLLDTARHLPQTHLWSLGITVATVVCLVVLRRVHKRIPAALLTLVLVSLGAWLCDAADKGVRLVGAIPQSLPPFSLPPALDMDAVRDLFLPALAIALLGAVESLTIGKTLAAAKGDRFDGSRELVGQGLGNMAAGLTSGIPGCGSFTRSALNVAAGGRTIFAAVFTGLAMLPVLFFMAPLGGYIPVAALGGILLVIAWGMIDRSAIHLCFVATRVDRIVMLVTVGAALALGLEQAVFIGVLLSLTLLLYKEAHPRVTLLKADSPLLATMPLAEQCPQVPVYVIEGTLFFGAISELERQLQEQESASARCIVLHLARVFWIDASGAHALDQFTERCHARSVPLVLVVNDTVRDTLTRTGVLDHLGEGFVTDTLDQALHSVRALLRGDQCTLCLPGAKPCLPPIPRAGEAGPR